MFRKTLYACLAVCGLTAAAAQAQQLPQPNTPPSGLYNQTEATNAEIRHQKNPLRNTASAIRQFSYQNRHALQYGAVPVVLGAAWYGTYKALDHDIQEENMEERSPIKEFAARQVEPLGRGITWVPGFGGLLAYSVIARDKKAQKAAVCGLGAFFINSAVTDKLKKTFNRHRPNSGSEFDTWDGPEHATGQHHSFPSSHTSTAFSAATVIATVYKDNVFVPVAAYSMASMVGLSRIYQNHHWASDVLAGAAVGFICAKTTVATYNWLEKKNMMIYPMVGGGKTGLTATMAF